MPAYIARTTVRWCLTERGFIHAQVKTGMAWFSGAPRCVLAWVIVCMFTRSL